MKKRFITLIAGIVLLSACGNEQPEEILELEDLTASRDSIRVIEGEFIFIADAAVLKGPDFIYGVKIDSLSTELANRVAPLKNSDFEMVPVKVKAKIVANPSPEGWDEFLEIKQILEVSDEKAQDTITVQ